METKSQMPYRIHIGKQSLCSLLESVGGLLLVIVVFLIVSFSLNPSIRDITLAMAGWFAIMLGIFIVVILINMLSLAFISYELTPQTMIMRGGIIAKYERNVPFSRIQHVVLAQTLMQRLFHLSTLQVQNADQGNITQTNNNLLLANVSLPGLTKRDAETLRKEILEKVVKTKGSGIN